MIRKVRLISKFMTSQPDYHTVVIHILLNISRNEISRTVKFVQLIEYNQRNIFIQKSRTK